MRDGEIIAVVGVNSDKVQCNMTLLAIKHEVGETGDIVLSDFSMQFM